MQDKRENYEEKEEVPLLCLSSISLRGWFIAYPPSKLGQSVMSLRDMKADENTYISCISILFGRLSEEGEHLTRIMSGSEPSSENMAPEGVHGTRWL